jgi:hypothetical protein
MYKKTDNSFGLSKLRVEFCRFCAQRDSNHFLSGSGSQILSVHSAISRDGSPAAPETCIEYGLAQAVAHVPAVTG